MLMNALLEVEFNKNKQRPIATNHCHWLDQMCFQSDWPFVITRQNLLLISLSKPAIFTKTLECAASKTAISHFNGYKCNCKMQSQNF